MADDLRDARCHRNSRNTCAADKRIDLATRDPAHELAYKQAAYRSKDKCAQAENDDVNGLRAEEILCIASCADADAEQYGDDIDELILSGL